MPVLAAMQLRSIVMPLSEKEIADLIEFLKSLDETVTLKEPKLP